MDKLNDRLKQFRKANGLTQANMAKRLGISQPAYQQIEAGESESMRVSTLRKICVEFNISADELLGIEKPKIVEIATKPNRYMPIAGAPMPKVPKGRKP